MSKIVKLTVSKEKTQRLRKCWRCGAKLVRRSYGFYCPKCRHARHFSNTKTWRQWRKKI